MKPIRWPILMCNTSLGYRRDQAEIHVWYALYAEYRHTLLWIFVCLMLFDMKQYSSRSCRHASFLVIHVWLDSKNTTPPPKKNLRFGNRIWITFYKMLIFQDKLIYLISLWWSWKFDWYKRGTVTIWKKNYYHNGVFNNPKKIDIESWFVMETKGEKEFAKF